MRATEDAVRAWSNAIALLGKAGRALIVGLAGRLATELSLWSQSAIAEHEFESRVELELPPAVRVATITADRARLEECATALAGIEDAELYGPSQRGADLRLLIKFSYRSGAKIAEALKVLVLSSSTGGAIQNAKSGRSQRALKIKIDDPEVI
jgi:primosomal protein N' (replication factor Y)